MVVKLTLAQIKGFVAEGAATDISTDTKRRAGLSVIAVSHGAYGTNGMLLQGSNGRLYAITQRNSTVYFY